MPDDLRVKAGSEPARTLANRGLPGPIRPHGRAQGTLKTIDVGAAKAAQQSYTEGMTDPKPNKRRWLQFSLRALLVFVTFCAPPCSWLAVKIQQAKREEAAAAAIEKSGGTVWWDKNTPGPTWLRRVLGETFFRHAEDVTLMGDRVTDGTLEPLHAMNQLQALGLTFAKITDAGLEHINGIITLKKLDLSYTKVTDAGLEKLADLKELEDLSLTGTNVTDAGLDKLAGLNRLQSLYLCKTNVTNAGLEYLQRLTQLKYVNLLETHVTYAGVKKLQQALPNCKIER